MWNDEKLNLIINELTKIHSELWNINSRLDKVDSRLDKVDSRLDKVDSRLDKLDSRLNNIESELKILQDNFDDFREETEQNFELVHKLIDQAFQKIADNYNYQEKVRQIENIISTSPKRRYTNFNN